MSSKRLAIFDLGKTNAKMILRDPENDTTLASFSTPNTVATEGLYPHFDIEGLKAFVLTSLTDFTTHGPIDAIMVSTHGAGIACMSADDLVLPVMDYEFRGIEESAEAYDVIRPDISVTGSYRMPRGLHLGAQLHWLALTKPDEIKHVDRLLFWPQYWTHWLSGIATSEIAYAGCHTDLWDFETASYLNLPELGLDLPNLMPPLEQSGAPVGQLRSTLCDAIGQSTPPQVLCGGHDSSLALLPLALDHTGPVTVLSTGTWICIFALNGQNSPAVAGKGQMISLDIFGRPVTNVRYMGGDILARFMDMPYHEGETAPAHKLNDIFDSQTAWISDSAGLSIDVTRIPVKDRVECLSGLLGTETATCIKDINAQGPIFIDGPFATNERYLTDLEVSLGGGRLHGHVSPGVVGGIERLTMDSLARG
ncbi:MAG: FGGY family carbohydrate kinase [Pseudoruegeria sp.]